MILIKQRFLFKKAVVILVRALGRKSSVLLFKLVACDRAKAHAIARAQKCRRIFLWIEKTQWRPANDIPAAGGLERINAGLFSANPHRTGGNFFSWSRASRRGQSFRKTAQERKPRRKPDAIDAILGAAMKIDNFFGGNLRVSRYVVEIESEFRIVANRNLNQTSRRWFLLVMFLLGERLVNFLFQKFKYATGLACIAHHL